jgi:hypothetical protein
MSARFKFAFSCSPGAMRFDDFCGIQRTSIPFSVMERASQDCNQDRKSPLRSTAYRFAAGPRTHL